jgi:transposase-like protein
LADRIGISQKAAWFVNHRLREMLRETQPELLTGMVEVDESYVGGKNKNRHKDKKVEGSQGRSAADKTPVVGLLQRGGKVITYVTRDTDASTLQWLIRKNVATDAIIVTDAYRSYNGLNQVYDHVTVKHEDGGYVVKRGDHKFHTQNIENFWSQLKRGYVGVFHFISPQHLHRYCDEFATRYNNRHFSNIERFVTALNDCSGKRLTYNELTEAGAIN